MPAIPKRMLPSLSAEKVWILLFTSGPSTLRCIFRHSSIKNVSLSIFERLRLSSAAINSAG